ncbi:hypothetical protein [Massilia violaceinigra]|uniref:hypothetical protein n=1 Tax=Massilia violaceinigra TaxID=2045208 RepID=UPI0012FDF306|nr:hypothetical protein [Massilia violaceinigra]
MAMNYCEPFPRRVLYFVFGAFITIGSIALGFSLLAKRAELNQGEPVFNSLFVLVILCCGIGLMTTSVRFRLTLTPRSLTLRRAFTTRTIARSDIADYGKMTLQGNTNLFLYSSRQRRAIMRIPFVFEDGDAVMAWMAQRR